MTEEKKTMTMTSLWKESLCDEEGKVSSSRLQAQQMIVLGAVVAVAGLVLCAFGKDVSTYALGVLGICAGQGASNVWAGQKSKAKAKTP